MSQKVRNIDFVKQKGSAFDASNAKLLCNENVADQYLYEVPLAFKDTVDRLQQIVDRLPEFKGSMLRDLSQYTAQSAESDSAISTERSITHLQCTGTRNSAGFITSLTNEDLEVIRAHRFLILDLETTHLTRYSPPLKWKKTTKLGDKTTLGSAFNLQKGEYIPESAFTPRIRIVSVGFPDLTTGAIAGFAWDMDCLTEDEQLRLMTEVSMAYCWIGQNLTFDLSWFASYGIKTQPEYLLDAMMVVRDINPMLLHKMAESMAERMAFADEDEDEDGESQAKLAMAYIAKRLKLGKPSYAMTDIALASDLDLPDKVWQAPVNWSIPSHSLRSSQYDYCMDDVSDPLNIIRACLADYFARESKADVITLFDNMSIDDILASVFYVSLKRHPYTDISDAQRVTESEWHQTSYYATMRASLIFAHMHGNGAPFDVETARENQVRTMARIAALAEKVAENPHMAPMLDLMKSTSDGENNAMTLALRRAIHEYLGDPIPPNASSEDMDPYETEWDKTKNGQTSLGAKSLIITKVKGNTLDSIPFVRDFNALRAEKKTYGMVSDYIVRASNSVGGNRLHSLISPVAATARTTSSEPNLQNIKRGPEARGQFKVILGEDGRNALPLDAEWIDTVYAWVRQHMHGEERDAILRVLADIDEQSDRAIIASDFSAVEMRIAAALGERAWHEFNSDTYVSPMEASLNHAARIVYRKEHLITRDLAQAYVSLNEPTDYIRDALTGKWTHPMPKAVYRSEPERDDSGRIVLDDTGLPVMCTSDSSQESLKKYCFSVGKFGKPEEDYYYLNRIRLAWWASRVIRAGGPVLSKVFAHGIDPHLSTGLRMEDPNLQVLDYLLSLSKEEQAKLKKEKKAQRDSAKPVNFGLLYGLAAPGLWRSGRVAYGLNWSLEEAASARSIWMDTYPELPFWHAWTRTSYRIAAKKAWSKAKFGGGGFDRKKSPIPFATTLTGRPLYSIQPQQALNYQDQGTGAEIALRAISDIPDWLSSRLVLFVHDELAVELPAALAEFGKKIMEDVMVQSGTKILDIGYAAIPVEVETKYADHWEH